MRHGRGSCIRGVLASTKSRDGMKAYMDKCMLEMVCGERADIKVWKDKMYRQGKRPCWYAKCALRVNNEQKGANRRIRAAKGTRVHRGE